MGNLRLRQTRRANIFKTLPSTNAVVREKTTKLDLVVKRLRDLFAASSKGELVMIPVDQIGPEHTVRPFVRNIQ